MQKARRQRTTGRSPPPPPTACRHTVSGSVSLATWRPFHLSLRVLRCFSSPGSLPSLALRMTDLAAGRVAPFGDPGITACLQLPQAYRSLPRPSSPPCAKASTVRPYALDLSVSV